MKPIRVALSGSGFRLGAHLGALQAIADAGYRVIELAGTSGGSIVAALFASGMDLAVMRELCMHQDWAPMMRWSPMSMLRREGLCNGNPLLRFLTAMTSNVTFADLSVDLKVVAANLLSEREFEFSRAATPNVPIALAARASASIPIVFPAVSVAGALLVDGGTCDNVPAGRLTVDDVPRIGIYLVSDDAPLPPATDERKYGLLDLLPRLIDMMLAANETAHVDLASRNGATIVRVPTGYASSFDKHMSPALRQRLYDDGYTSTRAALSAMG